MPPPRRLQRAEMEAREEAEAETELMKTRGSLWDEVREREGTVGGFHLFLFHFEMSVRVSAKSG